MAPVTGKPIHVQAKARAMNVLHNMDVTGAQMTKVVITSTAITTTTVVPVVKPPVTHIYHGGVAHGAKPVHLFNPYVKVNV